MNRFVPLTVLVLLVGTGVGTYVAVGGSHARAALQKKAPIKEILDAAKSRGIIERYMYHTSGFDLSPEYTADGHVCIRNGALPLSTTTGPYPEQILVIGSSSVVGELKARKIARIARADGWPIRPGTCY